MKKILMMLSLILLSCFFLTSCGEKKLTLEDFEYETLTNGQQELKKYIGKANFMMNENIQLHLKVYGKSRRYVNESFIGQNRNIIHYEDYDEVYLEIEGKESVVHFLLSLRDEVEIISPVEMKTKMHEIITNMQTKYNSY
ncbi:MAG: WYL domain-containing protein [Longicatena sp.]|nr:WYL domain-containing protein [Longicatena sp.]